MKDQIPYITNAMKMIAEVRDIYEQRYPNSITSKELKDIEEDLATVRDMMNF